jgi:hypothetical protein
MTGTGRQLTVRWQPAKDGSAGRETTYIIQKTGGQEYRPTKMAELKETGPNLYPSINNLTVRLHKIRSHHISISF